MIGFVRPILLAAAWALALPRPSFALAAPPTSEASPPDGSDLVETIDATAKSAPGASEAELTAPVPSAPVPSAPVPGPSVAPSTAPVTASPEQSSERFELHGWARQSLELGLSKPPVPSADDRTILPYDQLAAKSQLFIRARYSRARWFEANVSGAISYSLFETAPAHADTTFDGFNGQSVRGVVEPQLYEAFIGLFTQDLDVRIGQQRLAWGNAEFLSPNDVMNARDLRDPLLSEAELRRIPSLMLRADLDLGFATLQGVVEPAFTPDRYDVYGSNWAAVQPDAPIWARGLANLAARSLDPTLQEPAQRLLAATQYPKSNFTAPVLGARLSWSAAGLDVNYYYQYGFDGPLLEVEPAFAQNLASLDYNTIGLANLQPWLSAIDAGTPPLAVRFVRRHHVGLDLATTAGPVALRLDAAYQSKRVFSRRDLIGVVSPSLEGVLSAEYQTGDQHKLALLEVEYTRVVDAPNAPLLIYSRDTAALAGDVRWPIWRAFGFELRGLLGLTSRTVIAQPELNLQSEHWVLSLGGVLLDGEAYSLGGHFRRNLEVYSKVKLLF